MAELERIIARIEADTSQLKRELRQAEQTTQTFATRSSNAVKRLGNRFTEFARSLVGVRGALAALAGATALGFVIKRHVELADALGKTADRIGLNVEAYQELEFAASQTGIPIELFNVALTALVRRQGEAIAGNKEFAGGFARLGITVEDLRQLSPEDLLGRVADGVNRLGSQSAKIAALDRVMSEAGRRLFNFARLGASGLEQLRQKARDSGIVLEEGLVRQAEATNDELDRLGRVISTQVSRAVLEGADDLEEMARVLGEVIPPAASLAVSGLRPFVSLVQTLEGINLSSFSGILEALRKLSPGGVPEALGLPSPEELANRVLGRGDDGSFARAETTRLQEMLRVMREVEAATGPVIDVTLDLEAAKKKEEERLKRVEAADKAAIRVKEQAVDRAEALVEATYTAEEAYRATLDDLAAMRGELEGLNLLTPEYEQALKRAGVQAKKTFDEAGKDAERAQEIMSELGFTFSSAFEDAVVSGKEFSEVLRGIEQDLLRLFIRQAITQPLFSAGSSLLTGLLLASAQGNAFTRSGVVPFARGGVVDGPTVFPFARGVGLMGEAGPEAILPLRRTAGGRLGVSAAGGGGGTVINVYAPPGSDVQQERRQLGGGLEEVNIVIDQIVGNAVEQPGTKTHRALKRTFGVGVRPTGFQA